MRSWRRCLSTSTPKLNSAPPGPLALRCAQLFEASQPSLSDNTSLDHREVVVRGLVRSVRKQKHWAFAEISDGSTIQPVQAILSPEQAADLTTGGAVEISGVWTPSPGRNQSHELKATDVKLVGEADPQTYPIQKKYHSQDFLRTIPHLRFRTPFNSLLSRFRSECEDEEYFRAPKYLTVSSQLHLEAYAADLGNVWTLSPTFRAEKSDTPRHLSEFYMLEAELNFVNDLDELTKFVESFIRELTEKLYNTPVARELFTAKRSGESGRTVVNSEVTERWKGLMGAATWPRITYTEAIELLQNASMKSDKVEFKSCPSWPAGIQVEHEKYLVSTVGNGAPIFITDYPKALKPFYMAPSGTQSTDPEKETVACFDLIMPKVCEVVGGSLREHRLENLIQNMREHEMLRARPNEGSSVASDDMTYPFLRPDEDLGSLRWYADLRRWGSAPHGGFGLGFDRFLSYLAGVGSIRDVVPFPRYFGKADC
ncbi:asparaginyl-tRNA synthetase [Coccidioides immitis RMSCC 3703]|uniref:Asparaginyl-tRNA synthetase n=1 Tax=Coccidioides immitis RMSCC 3703 TaxID=454286 RepID=A0A0J8QKS8_COCIT|nr:asparaginyl-tRNA synthetase [Coccidioides immitis RMSCC 3703]